MVVTMTEKEVAAAVERYLASILGGVWALDPDNNYKIMGSIEFKRVDPEEPPVEQAHG